MKCLLEVGAGVCLAQDLIAALSRPEPPLIDLHRRGGDAAERGIEFRTPESPASP